MRQISRTIKAKLKNEALKEEYFRIAEYLRKWIDEQQTILGEPVDVPKMVRCASDVSCRYHHIPRPWR